MESLEQLRALEHGVIIKAVQASSSSIGVDTMNDLERVRLMMNDVVNSEFASTS
jgi:CMP-2-keto-3-deoxyoctulosonic acid synthetase